MSKHKIFTLFLPILFIVIALLNFAWHAYAYRADILQKFDYRYWTYRFEHSQWSSKIKCLTTEPHINPHTCVWDDNWYQAHPKILPEYQKISIGDDGLYAYAGYAYITGVDPTLLNAELPPFGKYIIGLFELTTGVMGSFSLFFTGLSLVLLFVFTKITFKSNLLASISVLLFSFEPILIEQMRAPYLDTIYLCLFLLTSIFFLRQKYLLSGITLGLFMSVKPPFFAAIILVVFALYVVVQKKKVIKPMLLILLLAGLVYVLTYTRMFFLGHTLTNFIQVQKYMIHFYSTGAKAVIGAVVPMLLQGKWLTWFGQTLVVSEWTVLWPLGVVGAVSGGIVFFMNVKNKNGGVWFHILWVGGYVIFLALTPIFPRYLLLLLPFMYNLFIWGLLKGISLKYSWASVS